MADVECFDALDPSIRRRIDAALVAAAPERLPDQLSADLAGTPRTGFAAALAGQVYAQASSVGTWAWQIAAVPERRAAPAVSGLLKHLTQRLTGHAPDRSLDHGRGRATWWTTTSDGRAVAAGLGLHAGRRLLQMRVNLPLDPDHERPLGPAHEPADEQQAGAIATRPFRVGSDEQAWLALNRAAFEHHPEQGGWDLATLEQRQREPWWDPNGFLIHEVDGRMVGFCWTKIHDDPADPADPGDPADPADAGDGRVGEIYVIGVHPDAHGRGLGRALTAAGLSWMAEQGVRTAMLFVDADNAAARRTYDRLGFVVVAEQHAFSADLGSG